jgi:hypothetical protein
MKTSRLPLLAFFCFSWTLLLQSKEAAAYPAGPASPLNAGYGISTPTNGSTMGPTGVVGTPINPAADETAESQRALDQRLKEDFPASNSAAYPNGAIPNPASPYLAYPNPAIPNPAYPAAEYPSSSYPAGSASTLGAPSTAVPARHY